MLLNFIENADSKILLFKALCDSNATQTPRVQSPAVTRPRLPKKKTSLITNTKLTNLDRLEADLPNLMSRRHQAPPRMTLGGDDDNGVITGATHRVLKPNTGAVKPPGASIRKPMKQAGVESRDRAEYGTKQGSHSRSGGDENTAPRKTDPLHNNMRQGGDGRIRGTIDSLIRDVEESNHDLLGNLASSRKTVIDDLNTSRQRVGFTGKTVPQRG